MRSLSFLLYTLSISLTVLAARTPCKRDACYRAVARSQSGGPDAGSRRADCVSILRTVIDDDQTATYTSYTSTFYPTDPVTATATDTTSFGSSTSTSTSLPPVIARAASPNPPRITDATSLLEKRDTIIIGGRLPNYASACTDLQQYAIACLCHGIRAQENLVDFRKTITVPGVFTAPPPTRTITRTVTDECIADTGCPQSDNECNPGRGACGCYRTDLGNRCMDNRFCGDRACSASSDCLAGEVCEIDSCCGRGNCTPLGTCSDTNSPSRIFRMDIANQRSFKSSKNYSPERRLFEKSARRI